MKHLIIIFLVFLLPAAVTAKEKQHQKAPADKECAECHAAQAEVWYDGAHGLMDVKCVVCHGSIDKNFVLKPDLYKCRGCHGEQVKDIETKLPKTKDCFLCHDPHSVKVSFHVKGGK